jgi:hypothetical protein
MKMVAAAATAQTTMTLALKSRRIKGGNAMRKVRRRKRGSHPRRKVGLRVGREPKRRQVTKVEGRWLTRQHQLRHHRKKARNL